ncbi:hypothetical protein AB0H12_39020 [Actinosynnema sp. NPDC023794]
MRFAFYGRTSTIEHQDPETSRAWQLEVCEVLVAGHGRIVAHFFDAGRPRRDRWRDEVMLEEAVDGVVGSEDHRNRHRPHQARDQLPPEARQHPTAVHDLDTHRLHRTPIPGGILNEYTRE